MWKNLAPVVNHTKYKKRQDITKLLHDGQMLSDKMAISNAMNKFFCTIGENLQEKIHNINPSLYKTYLHNPTVNSFYLSPLTETEISSELKKINPRKAVGIDNIGGKILHLCPDIFAQNLFKIFNKHISNGNYPDELKIAKVIALFKKGPKYISNNYRPISLLSCFNKIFEKLVCKRLVFYLESRDIFYKFQFGFRKYFSTALALIEATDTIRNLIDNKNYVLGLYVDLTKAFDTVDHEILLEKLNHYGIRGHANTFFRSYLTNRQQCTFINGHTSDLLNINCGVPQGSVLGPILFLIYINDLCCALNNYLVRLFADDTCILIHNSDLNVVIQQAKDALQCIMEWCSANKLTINTEKTCFIIYHSKNKNNYPNVQDIEINGINIKRVSSTKYLGVTFDQALTWEEHVNGLCKNLLKYFGIFNHIKSIVTKKVVRQLYFAFVYSRISYGIEVTGSCSNKLLSKLQTIQNQLLKLILRLERRTSTNVLHNNLHLLKVKDIHKVKIILFVQKCILGKCPSSFINYFNYRDGPYNLRHSLLDIPRSLTTMGSLCIFRYGAQLWNNLGEHIKQKQTQLNFKNFLINFYVTHYI
jgi:hypothetical protein